MTVFLVFVALFILWFGACFPAFTALSLNGLTAWLIYLLDINTATLQHDVFQMFVAICIGAFIAPHLVLNFLHWIFVGERR